MEDHLVRNLCSLRERKSGDARQPIHSHLDSFKYCYFKVIQCDTEDK